MESRVELGFYNDHKEMWFSKVSVEFSSRDFLNLITKYNFTLTAKSGDLWVWTNGDIILELDSRSMIDDKFFVSDLRVQGSVDAVSDFITDMRFTLDRHIKYV